MNHKSSAFTNCQHIHEATTHSESETSHQTNLHDITANNGTMIIMRGTMQQHFTHEAPRVIAAKGEAMGPRINITFRQLI
jgi:alkylated DNA repair dioxygenase AlkB